jgi:hypothetical protein
MAKFMSSYPYQFSINEIARNMVYEYIKQKCGLSKDVISEMQITPNDEFDSLLETKSVRDIAHAFDNIEKQVIIELIESHGYRFSTDAPIVWLLALIKLLFIDFYEPLTVQSILQLKQNGAAKIVGNFMLMTSITPDSCYLSNDEYITADIRTDETNLSTFRFSNKRKYYVERGKVDGALQVAIENAIKYVRDLK